MIDLAMAQQVVAQVSQQAGIPVPVLLWILGLMFTMISGSYVFTGLIFLIWRKDKREIYQRLTGFELNDLAHIEERLKKVEDKCTQKHSD